MTSQGFRVGGPGGHDDGQACSLGAAKQLTAKYSQVVSTLRQQLAGIRANLPIQLDTIVWFATIALVWLALTQIGLMMQGLEMMGLLFARPVGPSR